MPLRMTLVWIALRVISDRQRVLERMADDYHSKDRQRMADSMTARAEELAQQASHLRNVLADLLAAEPQEAGSEPPPQR